VEASHATAQQFSGGRAHRGRDGRGDQGKTGTGSLSEEKDRQTRDDHGNNNFLRQKRGLVASGQAE
jgi:hypothetical protein